MEMFNISSTFFIYAINVPFLEILLIIAKENFMFIKG
tara:strand:+ start:469 stop:579 length:111 start_codon:yes stop_codon:yes gene_type:complete